MRTYFLSDVWSGSQPDQVMKLIDILMGWMNHPFVHSKVFKETIIWFRNWRQQGIQKIGFYLHKIYIWSLTNKLMNKKTEIKSHMVMKKINKLIKQSDIWLEIFYRQGNQKLPSEVTFTWFQGLNIHTFTQGLKEWVS